MAKETTYFNDVVNREGWCAKTQLAILLEYIESQNNFSKFCDYIQEQSNTEDFYFNEDLQSRLPIGLIDALVSIKKNPSLSLFQAEIKLKMNSSSHNKNDNTKTYTIATACKDKITAADNAESILHDRYPLDDHQHILIGCIEMIPLDKYLYLMNNAPQRQPA